MHQDDPDRQRIHPGIMPARAPTRLTRDSDGRPDGLTRDPGGPAGAEAVAPVQRAFAW
ncbi:hypothetical protein GCM10022225_32060 [Plantactinospora mayteni]|uniref:Uncharacterized protein n=1 Tax=Plantactinospora mayteni TaxID=566021 RepID=A0ABQ4ELX3_9ACTN|nr:hypothetical protein Pma05_22030 [Plantactinospora mayteni]